MRLAECEVAESYVFDISSPLKFLKGKHESIKATGKKRKARGNDSCSGDGGDVELDRRVSHRLYSELSSWELK